MYANIVRTGLSPMLAMSNYEESRSELAIAEPRQVTIISSRSHTRRTYIVHYSLLTAQTGKIGNFTFELRWLNT